MTWGLPVSVPRTQVLLVPAPCPRRAPGAPLHGGRGVAAAEPGGRAAAARKGAASALRTISMRLLVVAGDGLPWIPPQKPKAEQHAPADAKTHPLGC